MMDNETIRIAVTSRALFDLEEENEIFQTFGIDRYLDKHQTKMDSKLHPGRVKLFLQTLQNFTCKEAHSGVKLEASLVSRNAWGDTASERITKAIEEKGLEIPQERQLFFDGKTKLPYLQKMDLYLSCNEVEVREVRYHGIGVGLVKTGYVCEKREDDTPISVLFTTSNDFPSKSYLETIFGKDNSYEFMLKRAAAIQEKSHRKVAGVIAKLQSLFQKFNSSESLAVHVVCSDSSLCMIEILIDAGVTIDHYHNSTDIVDPDVVFY